ncbi:MAG: hypothetical protein IPH45_21035, partial [Bacteroidales bacterium]|nr:hypothetical protein [Bacteroidales bacterium]
MVRIRTETDGLSYLAGPHLEMEYSKDGSTSIGSDAGWVDFIVFPPEKRTVVFAGNDMNVCEGESIQLNATAANYQSLQWSTSGTGTFSSTTILNPVYTPSASDIVAGSVTITLSVTGFSYKETSSSSFLLSINPRATAYAGADAAICSGAQYATSLASATNYANITWSSSGDGLFNDPNLLLPTCTPGTLDNTSGAVTLYMLVVSGKCPPISKRYPLQLNIHAFAHSHNYFC